jgi:hypothetical protein
VSVQRSSTGYVEGRRSFMVVFHEDTDEEEDAEEVKEVQKNNKREPMIKKRTITI